MLCINSGCLAFLRHNVDLYLGALFMGILGNFEIGVVVFMGILGNFESAIRAGHGDQHAMLFVSLGTATPRPNR